MKTYRKPLFKVVELDNEQLLAGSPGGVDTGGTPGDEFDPTAPSYAKRNNLIIIDDEEEDY